MRDLNFDGRFLKSEPLIKVTFALWIEKMTTEDLNKIMLAAEKLEIVEYKIRPAVDVLYDIASRLSILEAEIVSPHSIMKKVNEYLENN